MSRAIRNGAPRTAKNQRISVTFPQLWRKRIKLRLFKLSRLSISPRTAVAAAALAGMLLIFWPARRLQSENFVFYLPQGSKVMPAEAANGTVYLPLLPVLNLNGQVSGLQEKRNELQVWFGGAHLQLRLRQSKIRLGKRTVDLFQPVLRSNGQWLVPVSFLTLVVPSLAGENVLYQAGTHRAFIGNIHPVSYTVRLQSQPSGAKLVVQFTGKVGIQTASTNGTWVIFLSGPPVAPMERVVRFHDPYIKELRFDDQDGRPKLILKPTEVGLNFYSQLTQGQQVLVADLVKPAGMPAPPEQQTAAATSPAIKSGAAAAPAPVPTQIGTPLPAVVLDAGHGGPDSGARSRDGILEKNVAANMAQKVAAALQAAGKCRVVMTRIGDADPSFEQRSLTANTTRPVAFVTFHAGELGDRSPVIAVYTYQPPSPAPASGMGSPFFVPWDWVQEAEQAPSRQLAQIFEQHFSQIAGAIVPPLTQAPVRQLRSINAPAVAVEVGTLSPTEDAGVIAQDSFEQQVANAAAAALEQFLGAPTLP